MMKTKLFTLFAALVCTAQVFAEDFVKDGIYYNIIGGDSVEVTFEGDYSYSYYNEYSGSVTIPATVEYNSATYKVTTIGYCAFYDCSSLTAITIPNSVTSIDVAAFCDCSSLTDITIPNSVTTIGYNAFYDCSSLTAITIPNSVTSIGSSAFCNCSSLTQTNYTGDLASWCKIRFEGSESNPTCYSHNLYINGQPLTKADIPEGITSISPYAFYGLTPLTEVTIPNSVITIGEYAFRECSNLTAVTIPNSVTTIGECAFRDCSSLTTVTIGTGLESLEVCAFKGCNKLTKFICNSTKAVEAEENEDDKSDSYIGENAQYGAFVLTNKQLDTIVAPAQLFDLSEPAWSNLTKSAKHIQINGGELTPDAFGVINRSFDKLQTLDISATTNTEIANNAFKGCYKLETLLLPAQLETVGYMSFAECVSLKALDIPATVTEIGDRAFEDCRSIETLTFGGKQPVSAPAWDSEETRIKGVSTLRWGASYTTADESALQRIGNWAFYNCHELQHLEIPEGVTEIGAAAFYGCTYLEDLTLPASVQSIGDNCFALCSKLQKITCLATTPPAIEAKTFYDVKRSIPLYVPASSITMYENDTYWGEFLNPQAAPDNATGVEDCEVRDAGCEVRKVIENGRLVIIQNGVRYSSLGVRL